MSGGDVPGSAEVYGFAVWIAASIATVFFLAWAYLPDSYLLAAGVQYFPNKQWALLLPAWFICAILFVSAWAYESVNQVFVKPFSSINTVSDRTAKSHRDLGLRSVESASQAGHHAPSLPLMHVTPHVASRVLYGGRTVDEALVDEVAFRYGRSSGADRGRGDARSRRK